MSQGGSSMVANWLVMAVMLLVSNEARRPVVVRQAQADVASLSADATQVINLRDIGGGRQSQPPRPEPRTASSPALPDEDEPPARALPDGADTEPTTAFTSAEKPVPDVDGVLVPPLLPADSGDAPTQLVPDGQVADTPRPAPATRTADNDPDEPTQQYRFDQEEL